MACGSALGSLRRISASVLTILLFPSLVFAQSPWERAASNLERTFTGPLARSLAPVAIVIGGLLFMYGEAGAKRQISGIVFGGGLALFAAALTAIGVLASAWAAQPVLAAATALAIACLLAVVDAGARLQGIDNAGINYLAFPTHLEPFFRGLVASIDIVYFVLVAAVALLLAVRRVDALRTRPE